LDKPYEKLQTAFLDDGGCANSEDAGSQKTGAGEIAKKLKRTEGATRQKALSLGVSLDTRV
jgi:hypothetical protein